MKLFRAKEKVETAARPQDQTRQPDKSREARKARTGTHRKDNRIVRYFRQTWAELKKVHWPTRREATNLTIIVLVVTAAMSAFLGLMDWLSALFFTLIIGASG